MASHESLGHHETYGAVMKGPKGGLYVIHNGKKYYGAEYGQGAKFTKAAGVTDAMVAAASAKTGASPGGGAKATTAHVKPGYKSITENQAAAKAEGKTWTHSQQVAHAAEHGSADKYKAEQTAYHEGKLKTAQALGVNYDKVYHTAKLEELKGTPAAKAAPPAAKKAELAAAKQAQDASKPTAEQNAKAAQEVKAITSKLPAVALQNPGFKMPPHEDQVKEADALASKLNQASKTSIRQFSGSHSTVIRKAAVTGKPPDALVQAKNIELAMVHATPALADTYRGMSVSSSQLKDLLTKDHMFNSGPSSSSYNVITAQGFADNKGGTAYDGHPKDHKVVLKFKTPKGLPIQAISNIPSEREVLLPHAAKYKVTKRLYDPHSDMHVIEVEEAN